MRKKHQIAAGSACILLIFLWWMSAYRIEQYPTSTILLSANEQLLGASIAADGQWRFPITDSVPVRLEQCMLLFEDEYFYQHPGINPVSVFRAFRQNLNQHEVVSGASTITMQLARMVRNQPRNYFQKAIEMFLALRLELHYSKTDILRYYASLAPFGGNVVGIDAAAWRYFGRQAYTLSWAESATLAVLPNDPGMIFPGRASESLRHKRDFLIHKLLERGILDSMTYELSLQEPIPDKPFDIPQQASHLLSTLLPVYGATQITTTLSEYWQQNTNKIADRYHRILKTNGVDNLAIMVLSLRDGKVLSYVGNTSDPSADGYQVDVIRRPRSSGSILKPALYALCLDQGLILPSTLLPDIPTFFGGYTPKNFSMGYEGMVPADQALAMSLNIPFTYLLRDYSYEKFHQDLRLMGFSTITQPPGHYGLSLILGGAEVTLWDLSQMYFSMYRKLVHEQNLQIAVTSKSDTLTALPMERINIWHTFQSMTELQRTGTESNWQNFSSSQRIAWKTGTSFGFRDAWAVGLNGDVLVAVWVGNADGEGRAGLVGSSTAGPILNEVIRLSDYDPEWLENARPIGTSKLVCKQSGLLATELCPETINSTFGKNAEYAGYCPYHQSIWVDASGQYAVNRDCYPAASAQQKTYFILPPTEGYYYAKMHSDYIGRPAPLPGCDTRSAQLLTVSYPTPQSRIFIPKELDGTYSEVILEASHQQPDALVHWHINNEYLGATSSEHKMSVKLQRGQYLLRIVDENGNESTRQFEVVSGE